MILFFEGLAVLNQDTSSFGPACDFISIAARVQVRVGGKCQRGIVICYCVCGIVVTLIHYLLLTIIVGYNTSPALDVPIFYERGRPPDDFGSYAAYVSGWNYKWTY